MTLNGKILAMICLAACACGQLLAQPNPLIVARQGNHLLITAPRLHFLEGKPLEQLHNGASVTYIFNLTVAAGGSPAFRMRARFILSYDLWEEKFSIVQAEPAGRTVSHLSAAAAESWCIENMQIPLTALRAEKSFHVRLECTVADSEQNEISSGLTLAGLIDVLSRKKREELPRWEAVSAPLRLSDLKEKNARD
jgi:hypothetical protein